MANLILTIPKCPKTGNTSWQLPFDYPDQFQPCILRPKLQKSSGQAQSTDDLYFTGPLYIDIGTAALLPI